MKNTKEVTVWCWVHDTDNLYRGDSFESALYEELLDTKKYNSDDKDFMLLFAKLEELKDTQSEGGIMYDLFRDNITLDFDFTKDLRLFDIMRANCFYSETEIGKALIHLIEHAELEFVLCNRSWYETNKLVLEFEMTHCDYSREVHYKFLKGEYNIN
jgi:hypothetical protein